MTTQHDSVPASQLAPPEGGSRSSTGKILLRAAALSLLAVSVVSLYPPLGTAVYGPPAYPFALAAFFFVAICAALWVGTHWNELAARPERWTIPMAAAFCFAFLTSPFADRAAFPTLALLLLPAAIVLVTALVETGLDRAARCLLFFRAIATVAIGLSIWGLFSWAVIDFGTEAGMIDHIREITGLDADYPSLLSAANAHPFGHKNFAAGFALLALPLLLALVCLDRSRVRLLWLGGVPIVLLYMASAESRAAWLALAGGGACYLALRYLRPRAGKWNWWFFPLLIVVLAIPFLASPRLQESVQRIGQEETLAAIDPYRWDMFQTGIAVGNATPLAGIGPGALSLVSPEYSVADRYPVVYQVHSTPLQLYAETGVLGLLGSAALVWGLFGAWKRGRTKRPPLEKHLMDAAAVALLSYAAFALTDYQFDVPAIVLAVAVPAGALLGLGEKFRSSVSPKMWLLTGAATALLLLPLFWTNTKGFFARRHLETAVANLNAGEIDSFAAAAMRSHAWAPSDPFYLNQLANVWLTEWLRAEDQTEKSRMSEKAQLALQQSLEIAPAQDSVHFNWGILLQAEGNVSEALDAFQEALKYNPRKRFAWFSSGQALLELGKEKEAAEAFAREVLVNPSSLFLPLWREPEIAPHLDARNEHYGRLAETIPTSPAQRYLFYWSIGERRAFEGDLSRQPDGFRVLVNALEGNPEAAIEKGPYTKQAFLVRAWLEPDEAESWLRAAFFQASHSAFSHSNLELIGNRLREADTFDQGFRALLQEPGLPMTPKQSRPRASGLFERNFYGAPLLDFYVYHEPIVLLLF